MARSASGWRRCAERHRAPLPQLALVKVERPVPLENRVSVVDLRFCALPVAAQDAG
jgi:hypothetical protein